MIHSAKISTFGERAVDTFYVQTALATKIEDRAKLTRIRKRLLEVLAEGDEGAAAKPAKKAAPKTAAKSPAADPGQDPQPARLTK